VSRSDHRAAGALAHLTLSEIRERWFGSPGKTPPPRVIAALADDPRAGARSLAELARGRRSARLRRRRRDRALLAFETRLWREGLTRIAGVDEAGMGPLAGPVVAAAVILPRDGVLPGLDDSKRLTTGQREALAVLIRERAVAVGVGLAEPEEIDRINIYQAGLQAMARAVAALSPSPEHLLVDARRVPGTDLPQEPLIGGDSRSATIAAASIIAKVTRDRLMADYEAAFPGYGFGRHKGYPTSRHRTALERLGPSPIHRRSFLLQGLREPRQTRLFLEEDRI
jgi:ribonuclease HII